MIPLQLITHSRQDCFKQCRKKHWFAYELGLRPINDAKALRMGSAGHAGLEALAKLGFEAAIEAVRKYYEVCPDGYDMLFWAYECETIERLIAGYHWYYGESVDYIQKEFAFDLPLVNPSTGETSDAFRRAGKIDGIVRMFDGRLVVMEHKFLSEDLDQYSPLWKRLRIDHQISNYVNSARDVGYEIESVLYDVIRKPTIKPTDVPLPDGDGIKIVLDSDGVRVKNKDGKWRQTADVEKGYVIQKRPMSPEEWGEKLAEDIQSRPSFYYTRVEVPRLESDLEEFRQELWDISETVREAQITGRHYRTCNKDTCSFCGYFDICTQPFDPESVPPGFIKLDNLHPELGELDVITNPSDAVAAEATDPASAISIPTQSEWIDETIVLS